MIIGAGPTGLSLACQFVRYGIDFVIGEKNEGVIPYSKAIGVQARSVLLRPDNHIGFVTTETSPDEVRAYLGEFVRHS